MINNGCYSYLTRSDEPESYVHDKITYFRRPEYFSRTDRQTFFSSIASMYIRLATDDYILGPDGRNLVRAFFNCGISPHTPQLTRSTGGERLPRWSLTRLHHPPGITTASWVSTICWRPAGREPPWKTRGCGVLSVSRQMSESWSWVRAPESMRLS